MVLDSPSSLQNWKTNFCFVSSDGWQFASGEGLDDALKLLRSWGTPVSDASFSLFYLYAFNSPDDCDIDVNIFVFAASTCPRLKRRYRAYVEKVREYLDELISPYLFFCISLDQSLPSIFEGMLRSSRIVSSLNCRLVKLNVLVLFFLIIFYYRNHD